MLLLCSQRVSCLFKIFQTFYISPRVQECVLQKWRLNETKLVNEIDIVAFVKSDGGKANNRNFKLSLTDANKMFLFHFSSSTFVEKCQFLKLSRCSFLFFFFFFRFCGEARFR